MDRVFGFFKRNKIGFWDISAFLLCFLFAFAGSLVSVNRFWQFDVFHYDFGIYNQAIWAVSQGKPPIIEHFIFGGKLIFADHFSPSIYLFSPLYWLTDRSEIILIAQAVVVALSGLVLFYIGKKITKNKLAPLAILISYFSFIGLQNAVITDFHEVTAATLPLMLVFLGISYKKKTLYFLSLIILLGFKESNFLVGVGIGFALFFLNKKWRKEAFGTIILSLVWGIVAIKFIIPHFSQGIYLYDIPFSVNPINYASSLFDNGIKRSTLFYSFGNFGFLPLLSPSFYILILQDFLTRFYPPFLTLSWGLGLHYSALASAILALSSVFSIRKLQKKFSPRIISIVCVILILNSIYLYHFVFHAPFALSYNKAFYQHSKSFGFLNVLVSKVPEDRTVMTTNNLAPHFKKQKILLFRDKCKTCKEEHFQMVLPDYIVADFRPGQNPNNWYGVGDFEKIRIALEKDKNYKAIYKTEYQFVYKKN